MNDLQKMKWLIGFRMAFIAMMATSSFVLNKFYGEGVAADIVTFMGSGAIFCLLSATASSLLGERWIKSQIVAQLVWDLGYTSVLVSITGGMYSAFVLLYCIYILFASMAMDTRGAIASSVGSALVFVAIAFRQLKGDSFVDPNYLPRLIFSASAILLFGGVVAWLFRNRERLARILEKTTADLRDLSDLHTAIVDHVSSGILYVDRHSKVLLMNRAASKILEASWVGKTLKDSEFSTMLNPEGRSESRIQTKSGSKILGHHFTRLPDGGYVVVFQDVTEIRELEEKLQLQDKLATVGQLAAGIAHEIRNPLASLSGSIQLMKSELKQGDTTDKLMSIILRETDRLDHLLQNFLNYAKPSSLYLENVKLYDLCKEVVDIAKNAPELKDRTFDIEIKMNRRLEAECDPKQLRQILWNLINNSVQATLGSGRIQIEAEELEGDGGPAVLFSVKDNGVGIPSASLNKIFDPFYTTKATGTGLGLALVYQMVKTHGGRVGVESEEGRGTKIWFEFPKKGRLQAGTDLDIRAAG